MTAAEGGWLKRLWACGARLVHRLHRAAAEAAEFSAPNLPAIGLIGALGFPLYYVIWEYWFHQPYENLPLRLIGAALFLSLALHRWWPAPLRRYFSVYWFIAVLYALPFFFTFMLFKNGFSMVWGMSMMASILLLILLVFDWLLVSVMFIGGSLLAYLVYSLGVGHFAFPLPYLEQLPIYLFALIAGNAFNYKREQLKQEKLRGMVAVSHNIAHELRTPLLSVRSGVAGIRRYLPALLQGYELARARGLAVEPVRQAHLDVLREVIDRMEAEIAYSNTVVDMLLVNTAADQVRAPQAEPASAAESVRRALDRYPFKPESAREKVHLRCRSDFMFMGSDVLLMHVIFNLLRNALYAISEAKKGEIFIEIEAGPESGCILFRDTGTGIPKRALPFIFERFYSSKATGQGTGLGLSFCKLVMHSLGGEIDCRSQLGEYTEFRLLIPRLRGEPVPREQVQPA